MCVAKVNATALPPAFCLIFDAIEGGLYSDLGLRYTKYRHIHRPEAVCWFPQKMQKPEMRFYTHTNRILSFFIAKPWLPKEKSAAGGALKFSPKCVLSYVTFLLFVCRRMKQEINSERHQFL